MVGFDGMLARKLDFGEFPAAVTSTGGRGRAGLRLASGSGDLTGPDKYKVLDARRRRAQISARRLLDLLDAKGRAGWL
jgi:hypothetical protein